jgi:Ion channel
MTTVGYGDITVTKESTRWFGVFFILLCVLVFATALNTFGVIYGDVMLVRKRKNLFKKSINLARLEELVANTSYSHSSNGSGRGSGIDKFDFVIEILLQLELINRRRDVEPLLRVKTPLYY